MCYSKAGILYEQQGQKEKAVALWREALAKLHPPSPEYREVQGWLEEVPDSESRLLSTDSENRLSR